MTQKFSLAQQIEEIDRELKKRATVYPRLVAKGDLRQSEADYLVARMQAVKATLEMFAAHEAVIRELAARGWAL